jgi:hypothetical protein
MIGVSMRVSLRTAGTLVVALTGIVGHQGHVQAQVSGGSTVELRWDWIQGTALRYHITSETRSASPSDSSIEPMHARRSAILRLMPVGCGLRAAIPCDTIAVTVEQDSIELQLGARAPMTIDAGRPRDRMMVRQTSQGWEAAGGAGAGWMVEQLAEVLPLSFPVGSVAIGERWPVRLRGSRENRMFGRMEFTLVGGATLDSVAGQLAWITVEASDSATSRSMAGATQIIATIVWDLQEGALSEGSIRRIGALESRRPGNKGTILSTLDSTAIRRAPDMPPVGAVP